MIPDLPLIGYADRLLDGPGDAVEFKVSSRSGQPFEARLVRVICGDPNPDGPGIQGDSGPLRSGGGAGFELDRVDHRLGSPPNTLILAASEQHGDTFVVVPEELPTHISTWPGEPPEALIRSDMAFFETGRGGAVFSVGSITYCGSLSHNGYDNNVSHITRNVLDRLVDPAPFTVGPEPEASGPAQPIDMDPTKSPERPPFLETAVEPERPDPMTLPAARQDVSTTAHEAVFRALGSPPLPRSRSG